MTTPPKMRLCGTLRFAQARRAFTLMELLVVIGIIAILMGLLLPVVKKMRYAAYSADTQSEISQISNACQAYYSTYHAFPGPFSNDQIEAEGQPNGVVTGIAMEIYTSTGGATPTYTAPGSPWPTSPWFVTGSENLVLGLMGGLRYDANNKVPAFAPAEVGLGPMSLNPQNPSRQQSFFQSGSTYLMWCELRSGAGSIYQTTTYNASDTPAQFTDAANNQAADSPIPEFVDRFPSPGPMPILYLRARTGASGVVSDGIVVDPSANFTAAYQYDLREITAYTNPAGNTGATATGGAALAAIGLPFLGNGVIPANIHNLSAIKPVGSSITWPLTPAVQGNSSLIVPAGPPNPNPGPRQTTNAPDGFGYFFNPSITPTNTTTQKYINYSGRPRAVDQFILISAGPDGIYGTSDDITSFGDVSQ